MNRGMSTSFPSLISPQQSTRRKHSQCKVGDDAVERLGHLAEHARLRHVRHVDEDVVRGVAVKRRAQTLLVEVVTNETDAAAEHEQTVERTDLAKNMSMGAQCEDNGTSIP